MFDHFRGEEFVVQERKGHTDGEYGELFAKIGGKLWKRSSKNFFSQKILEMFFLFDFL